MEAKVLCKKSIGIILALGIMLAGCSKGTDEAGIHLPDAGGPVTGTMAAQWEDSSAETNDAGIVRVAGDSIYTASWFHGYGANGRTGCKISRQQGSAGQAECIAELEGELATFLAGEDGAVYYLYKEKDGEEDHCYLRKDSADGATEYCKEIVPEGIGKEEFQHIKDGAVGSQGESCFLSTRGSVYLFSADGEFLCRPEHVWGQGRQEGKRGVVNYGGGLFLYEILENRVALWPLDFGEGAVGRKEYLLTEGQPEMVFSGYERGLYLSDGSSLWNYQPGNGGGAAILDWEDSNVNVQPDFVEQLGILEDGSLFVLCWDVFADKYNQLVVRRKEVSGVRERQTVILGIWRNSQKEIEDAVRDFNRWDKDYQVELLIYDEYGEFCEDLLKGQGADLFELGNQSVQMLAQKGVLEDLEPWFEKGGMSVEGLMPCVRDAGSVDGRLVCLIPSFCLMALVTEAGVTEGGGWTAEEFLGLGDSYPDSGLTDWDSQPDMLLLNHLCVRIGDYIDWEAGECHFDDGSFAGLLEGLEANSRKKYAGETYATKAEKLYNKEVLTQMVTVGNVTAYLELKEAYAGFGEITGYPNEGGRPWYRLNMNQIYGMNSSSDCKDGAWAFLAFLLGEEYQGKSFQGMPLFFPAVRDTLEQQLDEINGILEEANIIHTNPYTQERREEYPELTQEDKEFIRYMAENAGWDNSMEVREVETIIMEEVSAYFEGDKTAQEVARIIQNRITLYLEE